MVCHVLTNPQHFVEYAKQKNITYEYLLEAFECIGQQATARMFSGSSSRGLLQSKSSATIMNWMKTFQFIKENPDHIDNDQQQAKSIQKIGTEWDDFVTLIRKPISDSEVEYWKTLSSNKLGDQAVLHGITLGVRNNKAVKNLLERMILMVRRRRINIWDNKTFQHDELVSKDSMSKDYRYMNLFELKDVAKSLNIPIHKRNKNEIVALLNKLQNDPDTDKDDRLIYKKLTLIQLRDLSTERGMMNLNKLNRNALIKMNIEYDENRRFKMLENDTSRTNDKIFSIKRCMLELDDNNTYEFIIDTEGMINATAFCKTYNKKFNNYYVNKASQTFITEYMKRHNIQNESQIIQIRQGGTPELQGTWVQSDIAIDVARWVHPSFAVQIAEWVNKLIFEGFVVIDKPIFERLSDDSYDNEAITLEKQAHILEHTNCIALYIAYIGKGLVKIGSSDSRLCVREEKHTGCESEYDQFRLLKVFEISSRTIEHTVHKFLDKYRYPFNKQREIFRPNSRLKDFIDMVDKILQDNDLKLVLQKQIELNQKLQIELLEAKNMILSLQLQNQKEINTLNHRPIY